MSAIAPAKNGSSTDDSIPIPVPGNSVSIVSTAQNKKGKPKHHCCTDDTSATLDKTSQ